MKNQKKQKCIFTNNVVRVQCVDTYMLAAFVEDFIMLGMVMVFPKNTLHNFVVSTQRINNMLTE